MDREKKAGTFRVNGPCLLLACSLQDRIKDFRIYMSYTFGFVKEAEEEAGGGTGGYTVYMDKTEDIAKLNTDGGLEMAEVSYADPEEESESEHKDLTERSGQVYLDSCEDSRKKAVTVGNRITGIKIGSTVTIESDGDDMV